MTPLLPATTLAFTVPGSPVPCARARVFADRVTGRVRSAVPAKTRAYETTVATYAKIAANRARWVVEAGALYSIELTVYRDVRRGDVDNYLKAAMDALNGIAWLDDRQVCDAVVRVRYDKMRPRAEVKVERLENGKVAA